MDNNPYFLENSLIKIYDYETGKVSFREMAKQEFENLECSYLFRFNSLQIIIMCWNKEITKKSLSFNNMILERIYPYSLLNSSGISTLSRCTSFLNFNSEFLIDVNWGQSLADEIAHLQGLFSKSNIERVDEIERNWQTIENEIANENKRS